MGNRKYHAEHRLRLADEEKRVERVGLAENLRANFLVESEYSRV